MQNKTDEGKIIIWLLPNDNLATLAEKAAAKYLEDKGYEIIRNELSE